MITGLALPVSVLASFVAVWAFGFTLNTMSLLGLSLAIGILIDDAIVVRENIVRHVGMGKDHLKAAFEGTDEIGLAVTATTLSIVVVFIPIAFLGGVAGQWFKPFGADHRVLGAGVAVRVVLARPDALGLLARSAPAARAAATVLAHPGPLQPLVRPARRRLQARHRLGARPPRVDAGAGRACRSSAHWRCRRPAWWAARWFPRWTIRCSSSTSRRRPDRTSPTPGPRRRKQRASPGSSPKWLTPTPACRRRATRWTRARCS